MTSTAPRSESHGSTPPLEPDLDAARRFLDDWHALSGAPHFTLVRIHPETEAVSAAVFMWPAERDAALRWITSANKTSSVYFTVNTAKPTVLKKSKKADIETIGACHADLDPFDDDFAAERDRLYELADELAKRERPPTFIIDSGGGIQVFFCGAEPVPALPEYVVEIETLNDRLRCALGTPDSCWNIDRVMRLPHTVNHPNRMKRARGRTTSMATLLYSSGKTYGWRAIADEIASLETTPPLYARRVPYTRRPTPPGSAYDGSGDLPPYATEAQLQALFSEHPELPAVWDQTTCNPPLDTSASGWDQRWASALAHLGFTEAMIGSYLRSYRAHHEPTKSKQDRADYILRTVARAVRDRADAPDERVYINGADPEPEPPAVMPWEDALDLPMFHGPLGDLIRTVNPITEADPRGILTCLLVSLGNWIGRRYYLLVGADRHFAALQTVLIGTTALARKGTAGGIAEAAMRVFDPEWARLNIARSINSGQGIALAVKNLDEKSQPVGDKRLLFRIDEFADLLRKSSAEASVIMQTLRLAWDGVPLHNTSVTRPLYVADHTISMIGMCTQAELRGLIGPAELATGSYNRINFCPVTRSKVLPGHPPPITDEHLGAMKTLRAAIDRLPFKFRFAPTSIPVPLTLSPLASETACALKTKWETEGKNWVEQANARAYVHLLRYAMIFAVCDASPVIEPTHLAAAENLVTHFAQGMHQQATEELSDKVAQRILTYMRIEPTRMMSRSDIHGEIFQKNASARELENAIATLLHLGLITEHRVQTKGRPTTMYALVPLPR